MAPKKNPIKLKKCSVQLNRLELLGGVATQIQEQVCVRRCFVRLKRCNAASNMSPLPTKAAKDYKLRSCCIRLERLNVYAERSASPSASSIGSGHIQPVQNDDMPTSDDSELDNQI